MTRFRESSADAPLKMLRRRRRLARTTPTEKTSERLVGDLEIGLFGAHEIGLAGDDFALLVDEESAGLGDAEVGQFDVAFEGDHDVFEADIAVDNAEGLAVLVESWHGRRPGRARPGWR